MRRTTRFGFRWVVGVWGLLGISALPAAAQLSSSNPGTEQLAGLFEQSCIRFVGDVAGLRTWVASYNLPTVPGTLFLDGHTGRVFNASNSTGKLVLVSYDSGTCKVVAMAGDFLAVQKTLIADLERDGLTVTPVLERAKPDGTSMQAMYRASLGSNHWMLSVTEHPHMDAPGLAPQISLIATIDEGTPAAEQ